MSAMRPVYRELRKLELPAKIDTQCQTRSYYSINLSARSTSPAGTS